MKKCLALIISFSAFCTPLANASVEPSLADVCTTPPPKPLCMKLSNVRSCRLLKRGKRMRRESVVFSNGTTAVLQAGGCANSYKRITFIFDKNLSSNNDRWQAIAKNLAKNDFKPVLGHRVVGAMKRIARRGHNKPVYDLIMGYEQLMITEKEVSGKVHLTLTNNVDL